MVSLEPGIIMPTWTADCSWQTTPLNSSRIPGRQWIGKHRRPRAVSFQAKQNMIRRLEIEAENQYWPSTPYLSAEQEYGHAAERRAAAFEAIKAAKMAKFPPHRYDIYGHFPSLDSALRIQR
ncbi:large ribosomal subunit protein mL63-like isoform X4 [Vulpes vulpes]|uniref:Large ribosomal subunit protein mL63-like isoform X4 n=1 Tax=Vulpes vulpes TaxID=9627 RepID=A0ABM4YJ11_VULVU